MYRKCIGSDPTAARLDFALYEGREQIAKSAERSMQEMLDRYAAGVFVQKVIEQATAETEAVKA